MPAQILSVLPHPSASAASPEDGYGCEEQQSQIKEQAAVVDVLHVRQHAFGIGRVAAAACLPQATKAGLDGQ